MVWLLVVALLALPGLEFWLLVQLPVSPALLTVECAVTAGVGWWFARRDGLSLWSELESELRNGRLPTAEAVEAMLEVLGGWGLIVPGLITDLAGALLLLPPVRRALIQPIRSLLRSLI